MDMITKGTGGKGETWNSQLISYKQDLMFWILTYHEWKHLLENSSKCQTRQIIFYLKDIYKMIFCIFIIIQKRINNYTKILSNIFHNRKNYHEFAVWYDLEIHHQNLIHNFFHVENCFKNSTKFSEVTNNHHQKLDAQLFSRRKLLLKLDQNSRR